VTGEKGAKGAGKEVEEEEEENSLQIDEYAVPDTDEEDALLGSDKVLNCTVTTLQIVVEVLIM
jgi:hypothetical protein